MASTSCAPDSMAPTSMPTPGSHRPRLRPLAADRRLADLDSDPRLCVRLDSADRLHAELDADRRLAAKHRLYARRDAIHWLASGLDGADRFHPRLDIKRWLAMASMAPTGYAPASPQTADLPPRSDSRWPQQRRPAPPTPRRRLPPRRRRTAAHRSRHRAPAAPTPRRSPRALPPRSDSR
jgi:hypothetical protein